MNKQIYAEACNWFVELRSSDVDRDDRKHFDAWVRTSPEHLRAYLEVTEIWQDASMVSATGAMSAENLISRGRADSGDAVSLLRDREFAPLQMSSSKSFPPFLAGFRRRGYALAAAIALVTLGVGWVAWVGRSHSMHYVTQIGEQRSIQLDDGSHVQLNSKSRVRVNFTDAQRVIELAEGQALFDVAKDKARPFIVQSGAARVQAIGTRFDVYRRETATTVTVVDGRVAVGAGKPVVLEAGEQVTVMPTAISKPVETNLANATAWTERRLIFDSLPLPEVVEEFNRYNKRQISVAEAPQLANFKVSGVYSSTDPQLLVRFLREQQGIAVRETQSGISISVAQ